MTDSNDRLEMLMRRALNGDQRAYAELLEATARLLRPLLARRLSQACEIDDLMQEILISIHKARHTFDGNRPYRPWAYAIAKFRLQDFLRVHYADQLRHAVDLDELELPCAVTESGLSYESIHDEVQQLPKKQAAILQMLHRDGYTSREAAEKLGMNESAVKVAAHRAYKILRERLNR